jgi:phenylalanyl-tRNA synthetase beta chain
MRILVSWLKEYIDLPKTPQEIADLLTNAGLEVEGVEEITPSFKGVVVGKVVKASKHPNAERLTVAQVFDGTKEVSLVCGAPNCREGIIVALAQEGATLFPDGKDKPTLEVKKVQIRGVESSGMLCSEKELGISQIHDGIIEFEEKCKPGTAVNILFEDAVLEVSLTPNLGHCLSVLGIARELSAITGIPLKKKSWESAKDFPPQGVKQVPVSIKAKDECPRYSALVIDNIKVEKSPLWLRQKLELSGIRSVNNIVDITNFVMQEIGQPMHAFDFSQIDGGKIEVCLSQKGEGKTLELLDGGVKTIPDGAVVIADSKKPCALGGVMGSTNSSVSEKTHTCLLESAYFSPSPIRRTAKALGIHSESAKRFERGCDPEGTISALYYALELIKSVCPQAAITAFNDVATKQFLPVQLTCRISRTSDVLGYEVSAAEMEMLFTRLGFKVNFDGADTFTVTVPTFRHDIKEEIDLIEEVMRLSGIHPEKQGVSKYIGSTLPHYPLFTFERTIRDRLVAEGLQECVTCDLISPQLVESVKNHPIDQDSLVKVMNPISLDQSILRPSMLPGLLDVVKRNISQRNFDVSCFEIGNVHLKKADKFSEILVFGVLLCGKALAYHFSQESREVDFYDLKGIIENLVRALLIENITFEKSSLSIFHPGRQAKVLAHGLQVGSLGELHPELLRKFDIQERVLFAEFDVQDLYSLPKRSLTMQPLAEYPASDRDWTVTLPEEVDYSDILNAIQAAASPLLESVSLLAIFRHERLGADRKNVTLRFVFRDRTKTLSQEAVDQEHNRLTTIVLQSLTKKFKL